MESRSRSWWRKFLLVVGGIVLFVGVFMLIYAGYQYKWDWTGFNDHIGPNIRQYQPKKLLWDWLQLLGVLAIPVVVAFGTVWFTNKQKQVSDSENKDNQSETALQAYLDKMSELLLANHLRESVQDEEVQKIARVRTLTALGRLDAERKRSVLRFLHESGLIYKDKRIIDLSYANPHGAKLNKSNLGNAYLPGGLDGLYKREVNLSGAKLIGANLNRADLRDAIITQAQLAQANSLQEATRNDGSHQP